ncbi:MAG TPA: hypothetical protein VKU82_12675, partial [Planctomycetaceae bacterium]|nr:hypothetical protein [Planctomycetaceae bacterium]
AQRIVRVWRLTLGRPPTAQERRSAENFLAMSLADDAVGVEDSWARLIQALFATLDFRYVQ